MDTRKSVFSCLFVMMFTFVLFLASGQRNVFAVDTQAPSVDSGTITVNKKTANYQDKVTISMKVTDKSEIAYVDLQIVGCGEWEDLVVGAYNPSTKKYEFEFTPTYFGLNQIKCITAADEYGNELYYYNSACDKVYDGYDGKYINMSGANFTVSTGAYAEESDAPDVLFSTLTVNKPNPKLNDKILISMKMQDSSPIAFSRIYYAYRGNYAFIDGYPTDDGYWHFKAEPTGYGQYEVITVVTEDAFGNMSRYTDTSAKYYEQYKRYFTIEGTDIFADMSAADFYVQSEYTDDEKAPELIVSSFKFKKRYLTRYDGAEISFKVKENSILDLPACQIYYGGVAGDVACSSFEYDKKTNTYTSSVSGTFYGTHQIFEIILCDVFGNKVDYVDAESEVYKSLYTDIDEGVTLLDIYSTYFYVGLENKKTGTFVSNSTMDDTSELSVVQLEQEGKQLNKMLENGYNIKGYFEIDVDGACNMKKENSKVFFEAPEGFEEGDVLRIRHLLKNGKIQTQDSKVVNGKIGIDVNQFSPFVIEVKKAKDKNQFTKNGYIYRLTGKKTVSFAGTTKKSVKSIVIPDTVKIKGKKYKVTAIAPKALKNYKKLKKLTLGKNVKTIGAEAFMGCKNLKTITIKTTYLTKSKTGKNAFKGLGKKVKFALPKKKAKAYRKIISQRGLGK